MPQERDQRQHRDAAVGARAFRLRKKYQEVGFDPRTHPEEVLSRLLDLCRGLHRNLERRASAGDAPRAELLGSTPLETLANLTVWARDPPRTFRELRERYEAGERAFADSSLDEDLDNDLAGCCLEEIDLSRSRVVASFRGASLRGARFVQSNVKTCDFRDADLRGADFFGAALCATQFAGANLEGANFAGAFYHSRTLERGELPDW